MTFILALLSAVLIIDDKQSIISQGVEVNKTKIGFKLEGAIGHRRQEINPEVLLRFHLTVLLYRGAVQSGQTGERV